MGRFVGATLSDGSKRGFLLHKDCKSASLLQTIDLESENRVEERMRVCSGLRPKGKGLEIYKPISASDVESAKCGLIIPRNFDAHQFLQIHGLGDRWCLVHVCRVVDGRNVQVVTPVPLFVALAENFGADALDIGVGLQHYYALS